MNRGSVTAPSFCTQRSKLFILSKGRDNWNRHPQEMLLPIKIVKKIDFQGSGCVWALDIKVWVCHVRISHCPLRYFNSVVGAFFHSESQSDASWSRLADCKQNSMKLLIIFSHLTILVCLDKHKHQTSCVSRLSQENKTVA